MHGFPKTMLILGGIITLFSTIAVGVGYGSVFSSIDDQDDANLKLIWTGTAPTSWDASELESGWVYIYSSTDYGDDVEVTLIGADANNFFVSCETQDSCGAGISKDTGEFVRYLGELEYSTTTQTRLVEFNGTGEIEVYQETLGDLDWSIMTAGLGVWGCCCGVLFLIIGAISAAAINDNSPKLVVLQQPVYESGQYVPDSRRINQVQNTAPTIEQEALAYYQNLLHQGHSIETANELTEVYFPNWKK